jgi:hypothetical protein
MAFTQTDIGKICPFCNVGKLIQYKTGKVGCDKFCWKNKPQGQPTQSKSDVQVRIDKSIENKNKQIAYFNSVNSAIARNPEGSLKEILKWRDDFIDAWRAWSLENMVEDGTGAWTAKKQEYGKEAPQTSYNRTSEISDIEIDLQQ